MESNNSSRSLSALVEDESTSQTSYDTINLTKRINHKGFSVLVAVLFVAGENAGCALLALPYAMNGTGWTGAFLILLCAAYAGYAGIVLGKCWLIVEERRPKYQERCRYPYAAIGKMAYGEKMRALVSFCVQFTLVGSMVVVLLLCTQLINSLFAETTGICFCYWILIIAALLCPLLWLGTPSEFWPAAALALGSTSLAVIVIVYELYRVLATNRMPIDSYKPAPTVKSFFLAFGTIMFAYGGTAAFPTFQNDMKDKRKFPRAVIFGFIILLLLYLPTACLGYDIYGDKVNNNIILSLPTGINRKTIEILMAGHLFCAFLLVGNPPIQEIENWLKLPTGFGIKRIIVRVSVLLFVVFISETLPNFGKILNLIGGSAIALLSFVLPPLFYLKLCSMDSVEWPKKHISLLEKIWLYHIIVVGLFGGVICTISALIEILAPDSFSYPCYIKSDC